MSDKIRVRDARREDMPIVHTMASELATYLKIPYGAKTTPKDLQRDGFDTQPPLFHCLVAELCDDGEETVIGFAAYIYSYSMLSGLCLDLPALYVMEGHRSGGVGRQLIAGVAKAAVAADCRRLTFNVMEWTGVRKFYESVGAENFTDKLQLHVYQFSKQALEAAALGLTYTPESSTSL